jgi:hypothetical protein
MPQWTITDRLAPCGLRCDTCLARRDGEIESLAGRLRAKFGGFMAYHERFAGMDPVFADYPAFERMLDHLAQGRCNGCRSGECLLKGCPVQSCSAEKGADFCFACGDFPCHRLDDMPFLRERWLSANRRMAEIGPEAYWEKIKDKPRY